MIFKMVNAITFLLNGGKVNRKDDDPNKPNSLSGDDHFDDFEEI